MGNREEFEKCMVAFDPDQSLTLAAEYPHYASYVTSMAANMFESRQPEIDALKAEILQKSLEGWTEIQRLKAEVERLRGLSHDLPPLCEIERLQRNAAGPTPPAQSRESLVYDLTAPVITPPATEVEPVYQVMRKEKWDWDTVSSDEYEKLKGMKMRDRRILYTHPANDGLRKAADHAEGFLFAVSLIPQLGPKIREVALGHHENLRAELNKDKSC